MLAIKANETYLDFGTEKNTVFVLKRNAAGTVLHYKCLDDKKSPASLKNCRVTISARRRGFLEAGFTDQACAIHVNQFDFPGVASFTFDETTSDLPPGDYDLEIKVTDKNGIPRFYPNSQREAFAHLIVHDSISKAEELSGGA